MCNREQCGIRFRRRLILVNNMTRSRLIQLWFATVALVIVAAVALGLTVTIGTAVILLGLSLVPPAIVRHAVRFPPSLQGGG